MAPKDISGFEWRNFPNAAGIFAYGTVTGKFGHASHIQDSHTRPGLFVTIQGRDFLLCCHIVGVVCQQQVLVSLLQQGIDNRLVATRIPGRKEAVAYHINDLF